MSDTMLERVSAAIAKLGSVDVANYSHREMIARAAIEVTATALAERLEQIVEDRRKRKPRARQANEYILACVDIIRREARVALQSATDSEAAK
jgi:hypothetical protein